MRETYHVHVRKDFLVFSAAHFITFNGNVCERLHGHNYRVAVDVHGPLDENEYVVDFIALRDKSIAKYSHTGVEVRPRRPFLSEPQSHLKRSSFGNGFSLA